MNSYVSSPGNWLFKKLQSTSLQRFLEIEATYPWMRLWDWALGYGVRVLSVIEAGS